MFMSTSKIALFYLVIMAGFTAYAIAKHESWDVRAIIQRGLIYAILFAMAIGLYLALLGITTLLFNRITDSAMVASGLLAALAGIFGAPRIEQAFRRATDQFFFNERYDYSEVLQRLSDLHYHVERGEIIDRASEELRMLLRVERVRILIDSAPGTEKEFLEIPIALQGEILGRISLGAKLSGDPYSDEDQRLLRIFSFQLAIALGRAKLYEKVSRYSFELEDRVRERTREIKKLQEDQWQMIVEISHNLQSPLTIVKGNLGSLKEQLPANDHLAIFERSIDRVSRFAYDLLKLARLETDGVEPAAEAIDLAAVIDELLESLDVLATEQRIMLRRDLIPGLSACIPRSKLEELIMNLVSNAFTYRSPGRPHEVELRLSRSVRHAEICVRDTGIGIHPEEQERIFKRFYRAENSVSRGTGLGLAIVKKIVENYGGTIEVQSEFGKGSTFTVRLPLTS